MRYFNASTKMIYLITSFVYLFYLKNPKELYNKVVKQSYFEPNMNE